MTTVKTSELTGAALDWAVAKCEGYSKDTSNATEFAVRRRMFGVHKWSTLWQLAGPIIEREGMTIAFDAYGWEARHYDGESEPRVFVGATPLIAAMRCYVASKLGDEVEISEGLM